MNNAQQLRQIKLDHSLLTRDIARMMSVSVRSVDSWLVKPDSSNYRAMSDCKLDYLKLLIKSRVK